MANRSKMDVQTMIDIRTNRYEHDIRSIANSVFREVVKPHLEANQISLFNDGQGGWYLVADLPFHDDNGDEIVPRETYRTRIGDWQDEALVLLGRELYEIMILTPGLFTLNNLGGFMPEYDYDITRGRKVR